MEQPLRRRGDNDSVDVACKPIPIVLVKEYYWCPYYAYMRLTLWQHKPTPSMEAGKTELAHHRQDLIQALQEAGVEPVEEYWEAQVYSHRLNMGGRVDLLLVLEDDTLALVEAKLVASRRRLWKHPGILAQLAAYTIAAEETMRMRVSRAFLYSMETGRLHEARITPRHRSMAEHAAKELNAMAETGRPPLHEPPPPRWRCRLCGYWSICPWRRM